MTTCTITTKANNLKIITSIQKANFTVQLTLTRISGFFIVRKYFSSCKRHNQTTESRHIITSDNKLLNRQIP